MWILTQPQFTLVNTDMIMEIETRAYKNEIRCWSRDEEDFISLGFYETSKRGREVFNEIMNALADVKTNVFIMPEE